MRSNRLMASMAILAASAMAGASVAIDAAPSIASNNLMRGDHRSSSSANKRAPGAGMAFIRKARKLRNKRARA